MTAILSGFSAIARRGSSSKLGPLGIVRTPASGSANGGSVRAPGGATACGSATAAPKK